jgi:hypothetical protein
VDTRTEVLDPAGHGDAATIRGRRRS